MSLFFSSIIFLFGLAVGSFLNCIIYRLKTGESFFKGRSYCPFCQHQLSWPDLIPVFSFLFLKGKCHYCQKKISLQYPLVELATGFLFVLCFLFHVPWFIFIIACFLIIIFVYDLKHYIIPDKIIYPAIGITLIATLQGVPFGSSNFFAWQSALGAAGFFLAIVLLSRGHWMGVGDIKLGFLMGLILGFPNILVALFLAFLTGAIIGIGLIILGKKSLKSEVPFGPFLVIGTLVAMFWGPAIINWYLNFLMF